MEVNPLKQLVRSGIPPLSLEYHRVVRMTDRQPVGRQSILRVNSTELGVLYPAQYRPVTNRDRQCIRLCKWAAEHTLSDGQATADGDVILYFPVKMLKNNEGERLLLALFQKNADFVRRLILAFPQELLLEEPQTLIPLLNDWKALYGLRYLLEDYADAFCPMMRLSGMPLDFLLLDRSLLTPAVLASAAVRNAVSFAHDLQMQVVLPAGRPERAEEALLAAAQEAGCDCFIENQPVPSAKEVAADA